MKSSNDGRAPASGRAVASVLVGLAVATFLSGCPDGEPASAADVARRAGVENPVNEKVAQAVTQAVPRAGIRTELSLLRGSLRNHQLVHGSYPPNLGSLDPAVRLSYPDEYDYDPSTGTVTSKTFPEL